MIASALWTIAPISLLLASIAPGVAQNAPTPSAPTQKPDTRKLTLNLAIPPAAEAKPYPIEVVKGYILFRAKLAGQDAWVMLDNGAMPSVIDIGFAKAAGLRVESLEGTIRTVHSVVPKRLARDITLSAPGLIEVRTDGMAAVDLGPLSQAVGRKIDGLFGLDLLGQLVLAVQARKGTFRLGISGALKIDPLVPRVPLVDGRPKVALKMGDATVVVTLDLGDNGMLTLTPEAWKRVAPQGATLSTGGSMGADGQPFNIDKGVLPLVTLGRFTRKDVEVRVVPDDGGADGDGRLGVGFLRDCDFALDIKAGALWIIPYRRSTPQESQQ